MRRLPWGKGRQESWIHSDALPADSRLIVAAVASRTPAGAAAYPRHLSVSQNMPPNELKYGSDSVVLISGGNLPSGNRDDNSCVLDDGSNLLPIVINDQIEGTERACTVSVHCIG
jgi:hypothetical protein